MAIGKWNPFTQQIPPPQDAPAPLPLPIPCADAKQFGLENFGNTCYANSVLQALYFCGPFRDLVIQHEDPYTPLQASSSQVSPASASTSSNPPTLNRRKSERRPTVDSATPNGVQPSPMPPVSSSPRTLFSALRSLYVHISQNPAEKGTVAPRAFIEKLREVNEAFRNTMHQDAHEFLNYLLNRIVEEIQEEKKHRLASAEDLSQSVNSSSDASHPQSIMAGSSSSAFHSPGGTFIHKIFEGVLTSETRCLTCENVSTRDESFLDLSIDIEQNSSVTACLRQFSASEMLCQKNKFFCDACCDLQEAEKRMKIKQLPNVLALHLKRFKYQEDVQRYIKLAYRVAFPFELRLFNTVDDVSNPDRLYRLFAIVVHIGNGPNHGHYVSIIKTTGAWLVFDDETVDTIRESDISKYFGESNSGSAYVLYYQAVDLDPVALGLRSPSPEQVEQVVAHPDQPQRHLADSPASTSQTLPSLPPGLDLVPRESSAAPLASPSLPPQPVPIPPSREPLPTTPKSPRKSPSQLLRLSLGSPSSPIRALTIGTGATPEATSPEKIGPLHPVRQTAAPEKKPDSPSNVATSPLALSPKGDPASHEPVREKEKDEKRIPSWFRSRSFKGKPRPNSETNADQPPLPTTVVLETAPIPFHRPALSSQPKISAGSSGSFSNGSAHVNHRRPATSAGKPHTTSREGYAHNPPSLSTTPSVSSAGASSSTSSDRYTRALPPIPGSPQSKIPHGPPTSFVRGSSDFDRTHRRHNTDREPPKVFSTRPATSSGPSSADAPSSRYMNGSARVPPVSNGHVFHSANVDPFASLYNTVKSNSKSSTTKSQPLLANGRPKSAHGLSIQSLVGASSAASSAAGTTIRRATRKLSFSSQMLGFGKKDKKDRERESEREELPKSPNGHARPSPPPYNVNGFAA